MATIKFSEFDSGNINALGAEIVGLEGGVNKKFTASDLVNGLSTVVYVDGQISSLQTQITTNNTNITANTGNITTLQGQVSALQGNLSVAQGNIVLLENRVTSLESNVTINQDDITTLQGNVVTIEAQLANIADTDAQTISWDGVTANLTISNGNTVTLQEVLDNASNIQSVQSDIANLTSTTNTLSAITANNSSNITIIQGQIQDLQANGNIQLLTLDNSSNVLSISGGNTVDFTTVLGNVSGSSGVAGSNTQVQYNDGGVLAGDAGLVYDDAGAKTLKVGVGGGTLQVNNIDGYDSVGNGLMLRSDNGAGTKASHILMRSHVSGTETIFLQGNVDFTGTDGVDFSNTNVSGLPTNVTVTAYAETGWAGNIIPASNVTYDLGMHTSRWKDLYLAGNSIYLGNQTISATSGGLDVNLNTLTNDANVIALSGSIIPDTNSLFDLGSAEYKIRHLYLSDNSLYVGDLNISGAGNVMTSTGGTAHSVDLVIIPELSLEKTVHVLVDGNYTLADGVEGQIIHIVAGIPATRLGVAITVSNMMVFPDGSDPSETVQAVPNYILVPFESADSVGGTLITMIFAAGAWNFTKN